MRRFASLACAVVIGGCATQPVSITEAMPVPAKRMLSQQWAAPRDGAGHLVVIRDKGFTGGGCTFRFFVDTIPIADIEPAERIDLYVEPGEHVLTEKPIGFCGAGIASVEVVLRANQEKHYRISIGAGGDMAIQPAAP